MASIFDTLMTWPPSVEAWAATVVLLVAVTFLWAWLFG